MYYCDNMRHLICVPYSIENLHIMAEKLGIKRCWYHNGSYPHYDIPKRRIEEIHDRCNVVSPSELLLILKGSDKLDEVLEELDTCPEDHIEEWLLLTQKYNDAINEIKGKNNERVG